MTEQISALQGIRILDFSHVFQGPVATQLLADYGADVIKVERPGAGDWSRSWGPFIGELSMPFANLNRNKRSLAINVKHATGKEIILNLVQNADVLVHNFRSGVMEKLGLGYDAIKEVNPRLIYATSSGWGDSGPYAERGRGGHELMALAEAGWFYRADPETAPVPAGISADYTAGLMLAQAILLALVARTNTGRGQLVTTDLFSVAFHAHAWNAASSLNRDRLRTTEGVGVAEKAINKSFKTQDGWIEISPVFSDNALRDISVALGMGDLSQDARFATPNEQLANQHALNALLSARFVQHTTAEWIAVLEAQGVLCARVNTFEEAAQDPQIAANKMVVEMDHPHGGSLKLLGTPLRLHGTPPSYRRPPADLGEHSRQILCELGYAEAEVALFERDGIINATTA